MTVPVVLNQNDLRIRPGNEFVSPVWAVLSSAGGPFSLDGWSARMQARLGVTHPDVLREYTSDYGLTIGQTTVTSPVSGQSVQTGSVQLVLGRDDTADLPQLWVGVYDLQINLDDEPPRQYTIVPTARLYIVGGPTQ